MRATFQTMAQCLTQDEYRLYILNVMEGISQMKLAEMYDIAPQTVSRRVSRARKIITEKEKNE